MSWSRARSSQPLQRGQSPGPADPREQRLRTAAPSRVTSHPHTACSWPGSRLCPENAQRPGSSPAPSPQARVQEPDPPGRAEHCGYVLGKRLRNLQE